MVTVLTIGAIEIVRFFHRRYVARALAAHTRADARPAVVPVQAVAVSTD